MLISVPAGRVAEVENALNFLEALHQQTGSQVVIGLILRAARRRGWKAALADNQSASSGAVSDGTGSRQ